MRTFKEFLAERLQSPEKVLQRAARRYGPQIKRKVVDPEYGVLDKSKLIPLKKYDAKFANSAFDKYDTVPDSHPRESNVEFNIKDLHPGQEYVNVSNSKILKQKIGSKDGRISVVKHKGKNMIIDGHHTVYAAWGRGEKTIKATSFIDLDSIPNH